MNFITQVPAFDLSVIKVGKTVRAHSATFEVVNGTQTRDVVILEVEPNGLYFSGIYYNPDAKIQANFGRGFGKVYGDFMAVVKVTAIDVFSNLVQVESLMTEEEFILAQTPPAQEEDIPNEDVEPSDEAVSN